MIAVRCASLTEFGDDCLIFHFVGRRVLDSGSQGECPRHSRSLAIMLITPIPLHLSCPLILGVAAFSSLPLAQAEPADLFLGTCPPSPILGTTGPRRQQQHLRAQPEGRPTPSEPPRAPNMPLTLAGPPRRLSVTRLSLSRLTHLALGVCRRTRRRLRRPRAKRRCSLGDCPRLRLMRLFSRSGSHVPTSLWTPRSSAPLVPDFAMHFRLLFDR